MNIRLTAVLLLLIHADVYCDCGSIIESMIHCKKYSCMKRIEEEGKYIHYQILGKNNKGLCIYAEKYGDDEMVCYHSEDGMKMEKEYIKNVFKQELNPIINLRANECFFTHSSETDKDGIIIDSVDNDSDILSQYNSVRSIFFDENSVDTVVNEMQKFNKKLNFKSSAELIESVVENFGSETVKLDSIIYSFFDTWKVWVNGKLFSNTKDLKIQSVTEDRVTFIWNTEDKLIKRQTGHSKNIYFDDNSIKFTLYPKQEFDLQSLSIK